MQGPQRADVDMRPPARRAIACTLALGRCVLAYLTSFGELRCQGRRDPTEWLARSPDRQTLCRMTDSLRARATRALPEPDRRSIAAAQSFRCSDRFTR